MPRARRNYGSGSEITYDPISRPVQPIRLVNGRRSHHVRNCIFGMLAWVFALASLLGTATHILPESIQAWPYMPVVVSLVPWFALLAIVALVLAVISRRGFAAIMAIAAIGLQIWWQYPFFYNQTKLPRAAIAAVSGASMNTDDGYARLMTCNVYKGRADAQEIVDLVKSEHVEVLALQETTDDFVDALNRAGIADYLPYSQVSSSDGVYGNGLWSATPLGDPADDECGFQRFVHAGWHGELQRRHHARPFRFRAHHFADPKPLAAVEAIPR